MAYQLNEYCGICEEELLEDERSGIAYCAHCGELNDEYYAEVERLRSVPFIDGSTFDGLRVCKVCRDRETTDSHGMCSSCFQQWQIDQL